MALTGRDAPSAEYYYMWYHIASVAECPCLSIRVPIIRPSSGRPHRSPPDSFHRRGGEAYARARASASVRSISRPGMRSK